MRFQPASLVFWIALTAPGPALYLHAQTPTPQKKATANKKAAAALSGCVDEKEGHYVLVDDRALNPIANLEADGFPAEGFAKYMGQKVTVRGISNSGSTLPIFKVRTIETISETCAPTPQPEKK